VMDPHAVLGPVDPQVGQFPAASILKVLEQKDPNELDDQTLILADVSRKALKQTYDLVYQVLVSNEMPETHAAEIADKLTQGYYTHDYAISAQEAIAMGLKVRTELPVEVYQLMSLYPQPVQRTAGVDYVPVPYHPEPAPPQPARPATRPRPSRPRAKSRTQ
jgi:ClpP class serine protease